MEPVEAGPVERSHDVTARDGLTLDVLEVSPCEAAGGRAAATVVAGHAMLVDRRTLWRDDRPCLVASLVAAGCRVLVPGLRGHPPTGPPPGRRRDWSYDDLVEDTPSFLKLAADLAPSEPLFVLGHSLFGHTSLAFMGRYPEVAASRSVAGVVTLASGLWSPRWEPSFARRAQRRLATELTWAITRLVGYVPGRRVGFGTADESAGYWRDFTRTVRSGEWRARDGFDYWGGLSRVSCPVLAVVSEGDPLSPPELSLRFVEPLPRVKPLIVGSSRRADLRIDPAPSHMALVTSPSSRPVWEAVGRWIVERAEHTSSSPKSTSPEPPTT